MQTTHPLMVGVSLMTACGWQDENANIMERDNPVSIGVYQQSVASPREAFAIVRAAPELFGCFLNDGYFDLRNRWVTLWNKHDRLDPDKRNRFYHKGRFRSPEAIQLIIRNDPDLSPSRKDLLRAVAIEVAQRGQGFVNNPLHPRLFRGAVGENDFVRDEAAWLAAARRAGIFPRYRVQNILMTTVYWLDDGDGGKIRLPKVVPPYGVYQQSVGSLQEAAHIALGRNGIAGFCLNDISSNIDERSVSVKNLGINPFYYIGYARTPDELRLRVQNAGGMSKKEKQKVLVDIKWAVIDSQRPDEGPVYYVNSPSQPNLYRKLEKGDVVLDPGTGFTTFHLDLDGRPHVFPLPGESQEGWDKIIPVDFPRRSQSCLITCAA